MINAISKASIAKGAKAAKTVARTATFYEAPQNIVKAGKKQGFLKRLINRWLEAFNSPGYQKYRSIMNIGEFSALDKYI